MVQLFSMLMRINNPFVQLVFGILILTSCESKDLIPDGTAFDMQEDADTEISEPYKQQKQWFEFLCSQELGGRYSGSAGIKKAADYIAGVIKDGSLEIVSFEGKGVSMENILFKIQGYSDSTIVLGAHYDAYGFLTQSPLPGADDNTSGVSVLLTMIETIKKEKIVPPNSLTFCFFDGEEIGRFGSKFFVQENKEPIKLYINVDTCGSEKDYDLTVSFSSFCPELCHKYASLPDKIGALPIMEYAPRGYTTDCEPFEVNKIPFIAIGPNKIPTYLHSPNDVISHISFSRLDTIARELVSLVTED